MNKQFIKVHMQNVIHTYTDQHFGLPLTEKEEQELLNKIILKIDESGIEQFQDVIHDVIYTFFTDQEDE
ncbi:YqzH family protein [Halalkalibacter kiskunsagensis]|uniref:YqzH family protein n=1 Tax=Halalkalibacter kiskunsagensis TaxID=1548599 RepID=A0ABV6KJ99_9BACI